MITKCPDDNDGELFSELVQGSNQDVLNIQSQKHHLPDRDAVAAP
jgi:hypothetical protein